MKSRSRDGLAAKGLLSLKGTETHGRVQAPCFVSVQGRLIQTRILPTKTTLSTKVLCFLDQAI